MRYVRLGAGLAAMVVAAVASVPVSGGPITMSATPVWSIQADNAAVTSGGTPWFVSGDSTARSIAFNPATNHLLVQSRTNGNRLIVLDAKTGALVKELNTTGITGGTLTYNQVAVSADGVIFASNLVTNSQTSAFKIYRWDSESQSTGPTVVYSGDPTNGTAGLTGNQLRFGDTLKACGSVSGGTFQLMAAGQAQSGVEASLLSIDGSNTATFLRDTAVTSSALGLSFGAGNTFYTKGFGQNLIGEQFSGSTATNTVNATNASITSVTGMQADTALAGLFGMNTSSGNFNTYDLSDPNAAVVDSKAMPMPFGASSYAADINRTAGVDIGTIDGVPYAFSLFTNNSLAAFTYVPEPGTLGLLALAAPLLLRRRGRAR